MLYFVTLSVRLSLLWLFYLNNTLIWHLRFFGLGFMFFFFIDDVEVFNELNSEY